MEQTQKQKMLAGQLYHANDPEIQADQQSAKAWMERYNAALGATPHERRERAILHAWHGPCGLPAKGTRWCAGTSACAIPSG